GSIYTNSLRFNPPGAWGMSGDLVVALYASLSPPPGGARATAGSTVGCDHARRDAPGRRRPGSPGRSRVVGGPVTPSREHALAWAYDGAAHLRSLMSRMGDDAFAAPSGLPNWSRAHVLSHIARNADAMVNLLTWARTGTATPAYTSREQRDADIETGAARAPAAIREDVMESSDRLAAVVRAMPESAWSAPVRNPQGVEVPASVVPWARAREMWIHAVDLDVGASFADLPPPMLVALVDDVVGALGDRDGCPDLRLVARDQGRTWVLGVCPDPADSVTGTAAGIAAWLLGRSRGRDLRTDAGRRPPAVPRWL
ncbi:MAG: maleylpyruvate isomerase family mycothiol-dependent enzyme, partial [Pseudonocardia sp.]